MSTSFILAFSRFHFLLRGFASEACIYIHLCVYICVCLCLYLPKEVVGDGSAFEVQLIGSSQCDLFPSSWEENPFFSWLQSKLNRFPDVSPDQNYQ